MGKKRYNSCSLAIIKTLSYSGVFNYPLSYYQITSNLISNNYFSNKKIKKELNSLVEEGVVNKDNGSYILSNKNPCNLDQRKKYTQEILKNNEVVFKIIKKIPWVKMIGITGSAANYNVEKGGDIDLFFITEKNRLWISRGLVFLILKILNKLPAEKSKREICPNIFIDERKLSWTKKNRNLYIAHNIILMQPILNRDESYFKFMYENRWVSKYYNNFKINYPTNLNSNKNKGSKGIIFNLFEYLARKIESCYMRKKITTEVTSDKLIHFNKNDSSKSVLKEYKKNIKGIKNLNN